MADEKLLEAKRKKPEAAAARLAAKANQGAAGATKLSQASGKRTGVGSSSLPSKRSKPAGPVPVVDLDPSEHISAPSPLRSIHPNDLKKPSDGEGGSSNHMGGDDAGKLFGYSFQPLFLFLGLTSFCFLLFRKSCWCVD